MVIVILITTHSHICILFSWFLPEFMLRQRPKSSIQSDRWSVECWINFVFLSGRGKHWEKSSFVKWSEHLRAAVSALIFLNISIKWISFWHLQPQKGCGKFVCFMPAVIVALSSSCFFVMHRKWNIALFKAASYRDVWMLWKRISSKFMRRGFREKSQMEADDLMWQVRKKALMTWMNLLKKITKTREKKIN